MRNAFVGLALVLSLVSQGQLASYFTRHQTFGSKDGYRVFNNPGSITQDSKGLLWIGSDNGLISFDGEHFRNYRQNPSDSNSPPSNNLSFCYQDKKGRYWTWYPNYGLYQFDPGTKSFRKFQYANEKEFNIHQLNMGSPMETKNGEFWFCVPTYGIARWDEATQRIIPYSFCNTDSCVGYIKPTWTTKIIEDPTDGNFWVVTNSGLVHFNRTTGHFTVYLDKNSKLSHTLTDLYIDEEKNYWVATWGNGIQLFHPDTKQFTSFKWKAVNVPTRNIATHIGVYDNDHLWLNTLDSGLMLFDKRGKNFTVVRNSHNKEMLKGVQFFQNKKGIVWTVSARELMRVHPSENKFEYVSLKQSVDQVPGAQGLFSFLRQGDIVYAGLYFEGKLIRYNTRKKEQYIYRDPQIEGIRQLKPALNGNIWVASATGLFLLNPAKGTFTKIPGKEFLDRYISDIEMESDTSFYFSTWQGLYHYNSRSGRSVKLHSTQEQNRVIKILRGKNNRLWLATVGQGLASFDLTTKTFATLRSYNKNVPAGGCLSVEQTDDGSILFSIDNIGLGVLQHPFTQKEKLAIYNSSNGLPSDQVLRIFKDKQKRFWLYTTAGLCLLDAQTMKAQVFTEEDGLEENIVYSKPYFDEEGKMYLGFGDGYQVFHPDTLLQAKHEKGTMLLSAVQLNNTEIPFDSRRPLVLAHDQTNLSFLFSYLTNGHTPYQLYQYKMDGVDKDWSSRSAQASAQYNNLAPGSYLLRVRAVDEFGKWKSDELQIPIRVYPPWYNSWWFHVLIAAGALVIGIAFFRFRIKQIERENRLKTMYHKQVSEMEMRALRAQMNPHFIFNCLSSINRYIVKSDHKTASNYLTKFAKLIRLILDNSAAELVTLEKELQTLQLYIEMEMLRFDHVFDYQITVDESIQTETILLPTMLLQPYIENAIWHGLLNKKDGKGKLTIMIEEPSPLLLRVEIRDNGIGREMAHELRSKEALHNKSYGMQLTQERLKLMKRVYNKEAHVLVTDLAEEQKPTGTSVVLEIPVQYG